jgi:CHAT domain-containing protein
LYIVPGGVLSGIPFECLQLPDGRTVVEQYAISYHSAWRGISTDGSGNGAKENDAGVGNCGLIAFAPFAGMEENLATLAGAKGEAEEIASMFMAHGRQIKVFTGSAAGEAKLLDASESNGIIHIATHSRVDRQIPERSGLHLWKDPPSVTGDELLDGILEMGEVRGLRLRCSLLTISSCAIQQPGHRNRIGSPSVPADFLDAGAEQVIFSLWNVSDRHTRTLMTGFYRNYLNGDEFAEALRKAKVTMLRNPSTASPYFWAPFILSMQ